MKLAIMQPYFLPYIGYWQLMNAVDTFVIYDNIQFSKSGWIQRNRILVGGRDKMITLPIKKDSDYLDVRDRFLAENAEKLMAKNLRTISQSYKKAPNYENVFPIIESIFEYNNKNLFEFISNAIAQIKSYLNIDTEIIISSSIDIDHKELKGQDKVIAFCKALNSDHYLNSIGGKSLYRKEDFNNEGIQLQFLEPKIIEYPQFTHDFVPWLSILDVMMFNSNEEINLMLKKYKLS